MPADASDKIRPSKKVDPPRMPNGASVEKSIKEKRPPKRREGVHFSFSKGQGREVLARFQVDKAANVAVHDEAGVRRILRQSDRAAVEVDCAAGQFLFTRLVEMSVEKERTLLQGGRIFAVEQMPVR